MLSSIGEDMRALYLLRFRRATTHTETRNRQEYEFSARNVVLDLNCYESAALTDAHVKRYKFRTEDDIVEFRSATSLVNDQGQCNYCRMYSSTEGIAVKTQKIIACDTTDDDCNGVDLITILNYVMDAGCIDSIACINSDIDYPETSSRS